MNQIERARELFRVLESKGQCEFGEIARRAFCIQEKLAKREIN